MPLLSQAARLVDEVAKNGSIRRAAARVNASPSAVNRQILNLEAELGVALFERLPNGMRPRPGKQSWWRSGVGAGPRAASKHIFRS
jgi:DNA-binding transcriptional LysR family regulator